MTKLTTFIGLDGEMSGTDYEMHQLIQVGVCVDPLHPGGTFVSDIGWSSRNLIWDHGSAAVHEIPRQRVTAAPYPHHVDEWLVAWLNRRAHSSSRGLVAVGFNVAGFDVPFVRRTLPRFSQLLSYRTVDLNAILFTLERAGVGRYKDLKRAAKRFAEENLDRETSWHDAGYDAAAALLSFEYLTNLVAKEVRK